MDPIKGYHGLPEIHRPHFENHYIRGDHWGLTKALCKETWIFSPANQCLRKVFILTNSITSTINGGNFLLFYSPLLFKGPSKSKAFSFPSFLLSFLPSFLFLSFSLSLLLSFFLSFCLSFFLSFFHSCWPTPQPQQHGIWTMSLTYTATYGNAGSLTHWERPGIEPVSSWTLITFITCWATVGTPKSILIILLNGIWSFSLFIFSVV